MGLNWYRQLRWILIGPAAYLIQGVSCEPSGLTSAQSLPVEAVTAPLTQSCSTPRNNHYHTAAPALSPVLRNTLLSQAQKFTVKVTTPDNQGSGVIVQQRSGTYAVITNEHVVLDHDRITIHTYDGQVYQATRPQNATFGAKDLELLEFQSDRSNYPVATLTPSLHSSHGSSVLAAGFPHELKGESFQVTEGRVSHITNKSLNGGYQIGYSNWVPKGMSGGPVLNTKGQVIAINGLHAEPLWGNPYVWDDGTTPSETLFPLLSKLSWAIPAETVLESLPSVHQLQLSH